MNEVAVVTDALSDGYFLPVWARYYGGQFGRENLYVVTYDGQRVLDQAGIFNQLPMKSAYNENIRVSIFNDLAPRLLQRYSCVIRVDVDEFLVPDPHRYLGLRAFMAEVRAPYVTARGFDVVQLDDEPALDFQFAPLLSRRKFGVMASAYSKTCIVRRPVRWGLGFHTIDARPVFDDLYLFHMKFADASRRLDWFDYVAETCRSDEAHYRHFKAARLEFQATLAHFRGLPKREGASALRDRAFLARMEAAVQRRADGQFDFNGIPTTDNGLSEIPSEFAQF